MLNRFQLTFDGRSYTVAVDGHDVSQFVAAVDVHSTPSDMPQVVLHLVPTAVWPTELDLLARVQIGIPPDPPTVVADYLEGLDPVEVERAALSRADLESVPGGGTAAVLRQLAEWARGS